MPPPGPCLPGGLGTQSWAPFLGLCWAGGPVIAAAVPTPAHSPGKPRLAQAQAVTMPPIQPCPWLSLWAKEGGSCGPAGRAHYQRFLALCLQAGLAVPSSGMER